MLKMKGIKDNSVSQLINTNNSESQFKTLRQTESQNRSLSVVEVNSTEILNEWNRYVLKHPSAHFFSHPLWVRALENEFGLKSVILVCRDAEGNMKGILPLMPTLGLPLKKNELITSRRLSALPRTPLGGFLFDNQAVQQVLIEAAIKKISKHNNIYLQLKSYSSELNEGIENLNKLNWRESFYLNLPDSPNKIRFGNKKHHHKVKWAVNKAISFGIKIKEAKTENDLKEWYKLYLETVRWHMVPARPYRFFKFLSDYLIPKGLMKLLLAEYLEANKRKIIAGSVFLSFNDTVFYSFNGRNQTGLLNHANDLIQWEAIHNACEEGFKYYDMGEVSQCNTSLAQFKSKWGCNSKQIFHYYYSNNNRYNLGSSNISDANNVLRTVWRKLPLKVTQEWGVLTNRFL
ncbi:MAG TPA: peptidoglycan bridge formation glycyltransferase FemA/FemB family protein [Ignavibacteriaceae bacterium]|nr:peptidoglycan bridge formation glycyltransferase FemA/FemB family protein [Ignavibacteriaceae bacterium]